MIVNEHNIEINCDVGEGFGPFVVGNDEELIPMVDAINVACGFHAGDPLRIKNAIELGLKYKRKIGAHPGYADLRGFGRKFVHQTKAELVADIQYQISALEGLIRIHHGKMHHIKLHGALYNQSCTDEDLALQVEYALRPWKDCAYVYTLADAMLWKVLKSRGYKLKAEGFLDRRYANAFALQPRDQAGAVITHISDIKNNLFSLLYENRLRCADGHSEKISTIPQTFCIHGDNPHAKKILNGLRG